MPGDILRVFCDKIMKGFFHSLKHCRETVIRFSTGAALEIEKMDNFDYRAI